LPCVVELDRYSLPETMGLASAGRCSLQLLTLFVT